MPSRALNRVSLAVSLTLVLALPIAPRPAAAQLVVNEILADISTEGGCPGFGLPALCGDANGDAFRSAIEDEFIEIVNTGVAAVDLTGYQIESGSTLRHTFGSTVLQPGWVVVVFGGGTPTGDFGGALIETASSGSLFFVEGGDLVRLLDDSSQEVLAVNLGVDTPAANQNQSVVRDPDLTGSYAQHFVASGAASIFSPGTRIDGSDLMPPPEPPFFEDGFETGNTDGWSSVEQ